jgi:hypothetical protein
MLGSTLGKPRVLVDRFQCSSDRKVILELDYDLLISQSLENGEDELQHKMSGTLARTTQELPSILL